VRIYFSVYTENVYYLNISIIRMIGNLK